MCRIHKIEFFEDVGAWTKEHLCLNVVFTSHFCLGWCSNFVVLNLVRNRVFIRPCLGAKSLRNKI
jgi:hypothetical protein